MVIKITLCLFILTVLIVGCSKNEAISPPPPPTNLKIEVTNGSVNLSWDEVENADGYKIFLSD